MESTTLHPILRQLRHLAEVEQLSDGQLLERFLTRNEQAAFEVLVRRHGPAILGVCRRVLHDRDEAEDVFQATFLTLVRRAQRLDRQGSLGGWLYTVAYRLALRARADARRRAARAARPVASAADPLEELTARELCTALDEEVQRLPDCYRLVVLSCCLEGRRREETAQQLGWTPCKVKARLERGRQLLRRRLAQRGIVLTTALLTGELVQQAAAVRVPLLVGPTARAARAFATGDGSRDLSTLAVSLANGMLRGVAVGRIKAVVALLLGFGLVAASVAALAPRTSPAATEPAPKPLAVSGEPARADLFGDPLPPGALVRMGTIHFRHGNYISQLEYAPDGKTLVACSFNDVCAWDAATGRPVHRLSGFTFGSCPFALSPDRSTVAATTLEGRVQLWDLASGKQLRSWELPGVKELPENQRWVPCIVHAPDGRSLVTGGQDGVLRSWDVATGTELRRLSEPKAADRLAIFSPDGKTLAYAHTDKTIRLCYTATGREVMRMAAQSERRGGLAFSPDGKVLASTVLPQGRNVERAVRLWDVATGQELRRLTGHEALITAVAFAPDGRTIATSSRDGTLRIWVLATGEESRRITINRQGATALVFAPDGKTIASGGNDQTVHQWEIATGKELHVQPGHQDAIQELTLSPDGQTLATAGGDGVVWLWDTRTGKERCRLDGNLQSIATLLFTPDGRAVITSIHKDRTIRFWDPATGKEQHRIQEPEPWVAYLLAISPDGNVLAAGEMVPDPKVLVPQLRTTLWDVATGKELRTIQPEGIFTQLGFSSDGQTLVGLGIRMLTGQTRLQFLDVATGKERRAFDIPASMGGRMASAFAPDGRHFAIMDVDLTTAACFIRRIDLETGREIGRLNTGRLVFRSLVYSADGRTLAGQEETGGTIHTWELATGKERETFAGHRGGGYALAFSRDGTVLASAGNDTTALLWDVAGRLNPARGPLSAEDLGARWLELAGDDALQAERTIWTLVSAADQAVPYLRDRLPPAKGVDAAKVARLITDLDSEEFEVRKCALTALEALGDAAVPGVRKARAAGPSAEAQRHLDQLLERAEQAAQAPRGDSLRVMRALEVLEHLGTPDAQSLLEGLAQGAPEAMQTREAKASLGRLTRR